MDVLIPFALSILAVFGTVAAIACGESRDGFDRDGGRDPRSPLDTRND